MRWGPYSAARLVLQGVWQSVCEAEVLPWRHAVRGIGALQGGNDERATFRDSFNTNLNIPPHTTSRALMRTHDTR